MSNDIQRYSSKTMELASQIEAFDQIAKRVFDSKLKPAHAKSVADVFVIVAAAHDLGVPLTAAMSQIFPIENKIYIGVHLATALAKSHPDCLYWNVLECTATRCTIETQRRGSPAPERVTWTIEEADAIVVEKAIWSGDRRTGTEVSKLTDKLGWKNYPADYLHGRAAGRLGRRVYSDRLFGVFVKEEYDGDESEQRTQAAPARVSLIPDASAQPRIGATAHATTQPLADHKQIEAKHGPVSPLILTPDAEPAKVETRAPEAEATKPSTADDLTTKVNRIGKLVHPFMPDEMRPAELRSAIRKFSPDDIADILTQCEAATRDPDEGDALLRSLAGDILRGPADNE